MLVFALMAAGVLVTPSSLRAAAVDPVSVGTTWLVARFTRAELDPGLRWVDMVGLSLLAGVGFTVSLLVGQRAFGAGTPVDDHVRVAVLTASTTAAVLAAVVLGTRSRAYRRAEREGRQGTVWD